MCVMISINRIKSKKDYNILIINLAELVFLYEISSQPFSKESFP